MGMTMEEKGKYYHDRGFNCAQSVLCALGDYTGLDETAAAKLGTCFGGGMRCGSICGALTGGLMAIGCACFAGEDPAAEKEASTGLTKRLEEAFSAEMGTLLCSEIQEKYEKTRCEHCIVFAAEAAKKIIEEYKK